MEDHCALRRTAVFESELARNVELGLEPSGSVSCHISGTPSRQERWHYHDEYELQLVIQTRGRVYVGGHVGPFKPGSIFLIAPRAPHNLVSSDVPSSGVKERSIVIHFREDLMHRAMSLFPELADVVALLKRDHCGVEFLDAGQELHAAFRLVQKASGVARFAALVKLLQSLCKWITYRPLSRASSAPTRHESRGEKDPRVEAVMALVYRHFSEDLPLDRASHCAGTNPNVLSRLFRKETGVTYTNFLISVRVAKACEMLSTGDQQVSSICYLAGFNNISNFNRHFLKLKNMTPKEYRGHMLRRFQCAEVQT